MPSQISELTAASGNTMHLALQRELGRRYGHAIAWGNGEKWRGCPPMLGGAGDGWFSLQDRLFRAWSDRGQRWTILSIKEKFAALDMNAYSPDHAESGFRDMCYIEMASERICEVCGAPGRLAETPLKWLVTRCERHAAGNVAMSDSQALTRLSDFEQVENALQEMRAAAPDPTAPVDVTWQAIDEARGDGPVAQCLDRALVWIVESKNRLISSEQLTNYLPNSLARDLITALGQKEHQSASLVVDWITDRLQKTHRRLVAQDESPSYLILNAPNPFHIPW